MVFLLLPFLLPPPDDPDPPDPPDPPPSDELELLELDDESEEDGDEPLDDPEVSVLELDPGFALA